MAFEYITYKTNGTVSIRHCMELIGVARLVHFLIRCQLIIGKELLSKCLTSLPMLMFSSLFNRFLHKVKFEPKLKSISLLIVKEWILD